MSTCYCILREERIGAISFLTFHHMFLFNEELTCKIDSVSTISLGGNKRFAMHRRVISQIPLDAENLQSEDYKFLKVSFDTLSLFIFNMLGC